MNAATLHAWSSQAPPPRTGRRAAGPGSDLTRTYLMHHVFRRSPSPTSRRAPPRRRRTSLSHVAQSRRSLAVLRHLHPAPPGRGGRGPPARPTTTTTPRGGPPGRPRGGAPRHRGCARSVRIDRLTPPPDVHAHAELVASLRLAGELIGSHLDPAGAGDDATPPGGADAGRAGPHRGDALHVYAAAGGRRHPRPVVAHRVPGTDRRSTSPAPAQHLLWLATRAGFYVRPTSPTVGGDDRPPPVPPGLL